MGGLAEMVTELILQNMRFAWSNISKKEISFSFSISAFTLFHKFAKFNLFFPSLVMVSLL